MPVAEPVARVPREAPPSHRDPRQLGAAAVRAAPFPWRFSRLERRGALGATWRRWSPRASRRLPRAGAAGEAARDGRLRPRRAGAARRRQPNRAARSARAPPRPRVGRHRRDRPRAATASSATSPSSAPARAARSPRRCWPRRGSTCSSSSPGPTSTTDDYPTDPLEGLPMMYRDGGLTIAQGRPAIPVPVGRTVGGTTVINSGHLLPGARRGAGGLARPRPGSHGRRTSTPDYASAEEMLQVPPARHRDAWAGTGSSAWRGPRRSGPAAARSAATPAPASSAAPARSAARSTPSARRTSPTCRARSAAGARVRAGVKVQRVLTEDGRARGLECLAGYPDDRRRGARPNGNGAGGRPWQRAREGGDQRRAARSARRSCCCARASPTRTSAATCTSTPPPGSAPAIPRRSAAGRA